VQLPGSGLAATAEITAKLPATRVVAFAASQSRADLVDALRFGASGYLPKDMDPSRMPFALRAVADGEVAVPRSLVAVLIEEFRAPGSRALGPLSTVPTGPRLTTREWEVLALLRHGLPTGEIARRLFIAPVTVRSHVASILKKLETPDRETAIPLLDER